MEKVYIDKKYYFLADDVKFTDELFFKSCNGRIRNIIKQYNLTEVKDYIYCNKRTGSWTRIEGEPASKDKLFLRKIWVEENVPEFMTQEARNNRQVYIVDRAPPILDLDDEEQIYYEGYYYPIEVRGKRTVNDCYFSVDDVGELFGLKDLSKQLSSKKSAYKEDYDYRKFLINIGGKDYIKYFLTFNGLMHAIYVSHNPMARNIQEWASKTLFTLQVGSMNDKLDLLAGYIGIDSQIARRAISSNTSTVSCVYFFSLGYLHELRKSFKITGYDSSYDNHIVCKFGCTEDLYKRISTLSSEYRKIKKDIQLELLYYAPIDVKYKTIAEKEIENMFSIGYNLIENNVKTELVVIERKKFSTIKKQYTNLASNYSAKSNSEITNLRIENIQNKSMLEKENAELKVEMANLHKKYLEIIVSKNQEIARLREQSLRFLIESQ